MLETSARLLRLLSLLQVRRDWSGAELASRLDVTTRTVRNDVDRLRRLGYPVDAAPGVAGGYRLGESATMPPMLLEDDEAVAIAIALRSAAASAQGVGEASVRALLKLQRILPSRLRERLESFRVATLALPGSGTDADPDVLVTIAAAVRNAERLRFDYASHSGSPSRRDVEPYRLIAGSGRWYLFAWDTERGAWRTFRVDRARLHLPVGPRFTPKPLPSDDVIAEHVARGIGRATWRFRARVVVHAPADHVRQRIPVPLTVTEHARDRCEIMVGSDDPRTLALYLGMLDAEFDVIDAPELVIALRDLAARFERAAGADA
ncbi:helix-turn-helix transcriptional regulator [Microbacterium sp. B2969]|uniref:Helix-turn-helix transcriptional regulator n=1 Tax=Microbacterium alkaliflavum TaxID=3248839 RepID=A0ABW7QE92_9MICO